MAGSCFCSPRQFYFCRPVISKFYLDLHPTSEVISQKVGSNRVEHVNLVGFECYSFLVKVVPENIKTWLRRLMEDKI